MAASSRTDSGQHWIVRFMPLQTLVNAEALAQRFREVESLGRYVQERAQWLIAAVAAIVLIGIGCALSIVVYLADFHPLLTLPGIVLLPVVLIGSLFVQAYVFFTWIEGRALARELGQRHRQAPGAAAALLVKKFNLDMGPIPPVPWVLAAIFLLAPVCLLLLSSPLIALIVVLLGVLMPVVYAKFDS